MSWWLKGQSLERCWGTSVCCNPTIIAHLTWFQETIQENCFVFLIYFVEFYTWCIIICNYICSIMYYIYYNYNLSLYLYIWACYLSALLRNVYNFICQDIIAIQEHKWPKKRNNSKFLSLFFLLLFLSCKFLQVHTLYIT